MLYNGDCLKVIKTLPSNSIDAIVTDPPYGLSFMGKKWDYDVPKVEVWQECLRVLKPGGYLLSFAGTRTQHRMAVRIEDAGFEIRDMIAWCFGQGFPKSLNINKQFLKGLGYGNMVEYEKGQEVSKSRLSELWKRVVSSTLAKEENNNRGSLQGLLEDLEQGEQLKVFTSSFEGKEIQVSERQRQSCLERWSNLPTPQGELYCKCALCSLPTGIFINGKKRWLCYGTQTNNGETSWEVIDENGVCSSYQSQSIGQSAGEFNVVCEQCSAQTIRGSDGWGSALKPALEPITVARKPLSEANLADNYLKWGVGGINIDGCRVGTDKIHINGGGGGEGTGWGKKEEINEERNGRFPANLIHDGSDEVVELFPQTGKGNGGSAYNYAGKEYYNKETSMFNGDKPQAPSNFNDSGSAARFFYCAKASKSERNRGCEGMEEKLSGAYEFRNRESGKGQFDGKTNTLKANNHPTVKPISLMEYLVKLVSKEGHTVLDPFMGSGTTGIACKNLKREFVGIELDKDYFEIAKNRIENTIPKLL